MKVIAFDIGGTLMEYVVGLREANASRLTTGISVAFRPLRFDGRQPICTEKDKNHSETPRCEVQSSFSGADFRRDKANGEENTCVLSRRLTQYRRKSARKNRLGFASLSPMPYSWVEYYKQGFAAVNEKYALGATEADIQKSVEILKKYNPRVNYREEELSPEFLFTNAMAHWKKSIALSDCIDTFFGGFDLKAIIYPDTVPMLKKLKNMGYAIAALTDLPSSMPDELFKRDIPELLDLFDLYVSSQICGFRKPNTAGLKFIAEHFGVAVKELIFVGDEEKDRKTAENAPCRFIPINRNEKISGSICNLEELTVLLECGK